MLNLANKIINEIKKTLKKKKSGIHEPVFSNKEKQYLNDCINKSIVSSTGSSSNSYSKKFISKLKSITKSKYIILTNTGSAALHASFLVSGLKENYEILMPSLNYISNANSLLLCKGIPHFIEIDELSLGADIPKLEKYISNIAKVKNGKLYNKKTKNRIYGLQVLHTYGMPSNIDLIIKFAEKFKLFVIEDSAEALGSYYNKKHVGTFGDIAALSFNGNKIITTGMGGAIMTNNFKLYKKASSVIQLSKKDHKWKYEYSDIGFNYRLPNINAAIGLAQIEKLEIFLKLKLKLSMRYRKCFTKFSKELKFFEESKNCKSNNWLNTIILNNNYKKFRDKILEISNKQGLGMRGPWQLLHKVPHLKKFPRMNLKVTENLSKRIINLPSSANL
ncbi:MAG: aminotransferase DegT [Candidatus Pelagibacter sp.]|nr:aminotransferase DegT [Candidatus Pelagibacter sp.]OUV88662.1 MAG: hypothetical protein CBC96_00135 [Pelagibacteraceae bacterium TMED136]|tara:strand:+ start:11147 stop:12316 length:1170 start_codon:yes stop_codon:yes gene_type:complete